MAGTGDQGLAVVTGASSGIGAIYADRLAARGHDLLLVARRSDRLKQLGAALRERHGIEPTIVVADLEQAGDVARVEAHLRQSQVTLLVNNAGIGGLGPTAAQPIERIEGVLRLNILALTRLSLVALEGFRARGAGTLVNIGSVIGLNPAPAAAAYSGSKAYVLNFTRSLQLEYADSPIRIQLVQPGPVRTEFFAAAGVNDSIFPPETFLTPEQLVDAALAGLDAGERVTTPSLHHPTIWDALEEKRIAFMAATRTGEVAARYLNAVETRAPA